ncbi:LADA_0E05864g1_1 [Lachancea dasiensis]|uniref:LADA_0E05864g1_1 n=1 Tax=Lachancea dasiensis TaxID=1072105 RepID=A0A1G4JC81_9SACH|nr:LADA_0E05864g1_1 [Lachancea dasiensis]
MSILDKLPVEIQLRLLESHPQLAFVNTRWYRLNNKLGRDRCLRMKPEIYYRQTIEESICRYIKTLDHSRLAARLINVPHQYAEDDTFQCYISDSWHIIYSVLFQNPKFFAMDSAGRKMNAAQDTISEFYCPMELVTGRDYPCNLWFTKLSSSGRFGAIRVAVYGQPDGSEPLLQRDLPLSLPDWCESKGTYCIYGGEIKLPSSGNDLKVVHMGVSIVNGDGNFELQAVDTKRYQPQASWLLFKTHLTNIFNVSEKRLSADRMRWDEKQFANDMEGTQEEVEFEFLYRFPKDQSMTHNLSNVKYPSL